jgi:hypothetical protein
MAENNRENFFKYYARIIQHCVDNNNSYFTTEWFRSEFPDASYDSLKNMKNEHLLSADKNSRIYYVCSLYSHVHWIGKLCARYAYLPDGDPEACTELRACAAMTRLDPLIIEFLCVTADKKTSQRAAILEMTDKEMDTLETYFYLRIGAEAIRRRVKLPFSEEIINGDGSMFVRKVESATSSDA